MLIPKRMHGIPNFTSRCSFARQLELSLNLMRFVYWLCVIRSGLVVIHTCSIVWRLRFIWPILVQMQPLCLPAFSMTQLMIHSWTMIISSGCLVLVWPILLKG